MRADRPLSRRLDRCDRVIQNESRDPFGGNVYYVTMQITFLTRKIRNGERYLHCDVVHISTKWVSSLTLDCNGVFAIKAYGLMSKTTYCMLASKNIDIDAMRWPCRAEWELFYGMIQRSREDHNAWRKRLTANRPGRILNSLWNSRSNNLYKVGLHPRRTELSFNNLIVFTRKMYRMRTGLIIHYGYFTENIYKTNLNRKHI